MNKKLYAAIFGAVCHALFFIAVSSMGYMLFWGMSHPLTKLNLYFPRATNILLLLQFPILHSFFLTARGGKLLSKLHPYGLGKDLATTSFATFASIQLLIVFLFWSPSISIWFFPEGAILKVWVVVHLFSWLFLIKALYDAGFALQSGFLGWGAVIKGQSPKYSSFPERGLFKYCRQPIYLGFFAILITAPTWTLDHVLIATVWGFYCFFGAKLKEKRFERIFGSSFKAYQKRVPFVGVSLSFLHVPK